MRSPLIRRTFWVLFTFWFGPSIVLPDMLDHCPVHHFSMDGVAGHAATMNGSKPMPNHSSHRGCTCLDQGCTANGAVPTRAGVRVIATILFVDANAVSPDRIANPVSATDHLLPPTTGPPPRV